VTGAISINDEKCSGCLDCVDACRFDAIHLGPNNELLTCDLCGGEPTCVKYCPSRPDHSLPHLDFPAQSCLQYVEGKNVEDTR